MKMKRIEFIKDKYKITVESDFVKLLSCDRSIKLIQM